ncbi:FAD-dependent monooxygenase [Sphaerimonospora sp. CA-214678]|uniref:FAD-dependent monooxygenase n=1 Tax=Sphaerimonospora sp. CA-214678 TaxID=3240029 RepID=UPI003D8BFE45
MSTGKRVAVVGAGPAGLFLARMIGLTRSDAVVDVYERDGRDEVSGFGVSLSDRTLRGLARHDPGTHRRMTAAGVAVSGVEMRLPAATLRYDGFDLLSVSRHELLAILREQAEDVGARLHFRREVRVGDLDADVVALADGAHSAHRTARRRAFGTSVRTGRARYIWLGSTADFGDVTAFAFVQTEFGPMAAHCYPYGAGMSTVVVELDETTWRRAGLAGPDPAAPIGEAGLDLLTGIFAGHLGGHRLVGGGSRWGRFRVVRNERWSDGDTVLLGDAAHTAHFTVGSGTKMALEDAIALAGALSTHDDNATAFKAYERARRGPVARTQRLAEPSMTWWESYGRRLGLPPAQFGVHFLTRTGAISYLGLRRRCPERIDEAEAVFREEAGAAAGARPGNAIGVPLRLGSVRLPNRLVTVPPDTPSGPVPSGLVLVRGDAGEAAGAEAAPYGVVGRLLPPDAEPAAGEPGTPCLVELACPDGPEWTAAADALVERARLLRRRRVDGVLLRPGRPVELCWDEMLRHAARVRVEAGLPVAVYAPADWALDLAREADTDPWPTRIHVGLVSGRIDLVAVAGHARPAYSKLPSPGNLLKRHRLP